MQVGAPARVGLVAPVDVTVPAGNTGLDPSQTNFFQVTGADTILQTPHKGQALLPLMRCSVEVPGSLAGPPAQRSVKMWQGRSAC